MERVRHSNDAMRSLKFSIASIGDHHYDLHSLAYVDRNFAPFRLAAPE
jgi:hypothetical protein